MNNLFKNTGTYRGGRYSGSKKHIRTGVPCDGCSHCDSKCCTEADCVCVDCPPAVITKRGQLKIIDNRDLGAKFMNNLFKNTRTYRGDRYSRAEGVGACKLGCYSAFPFKRTARNKCKAACETLQTRAEEAPSMFDQFLPPDTGNNGNGGGGNGGGGNGGGGNGGGANGNGEGPDTQTIMIWVGVALLLIALIIGGAIAIKKIRT